MIQTFHKVARSESQFDIKVAEIMMTTSCELWCFHNKPCLSFISAIYEIAPSGTNLCEIICESLVRFAERHCDMQKGGRLIVLDWLVSFSSFSWIFSRSVESTCRRSSERARTHVKTVQCSFQCLHDLCDMAVPKIHRLHSGQST